MTKICWTCAHNPEPYVLLITRAALLCYHVTRQRCHSHAYDHVSVRAVRCAPTPGYLSGNVHTDQTTAHQVDQQHWKGCLGQHSSCVRAAHLCLAPQAGGKTVGDPVGCAPTPDLHGASGQAHTRDRAVVLVFRYLQTRADRADREGAMYAPAATRASGIKQRSSARAVAGRMGRRLPSSGHAPVSAHHRNAAPAAEAHTRKQLATWWLSRAASAQADSKVALPAANAPARGVEPGTLTIRCVLATRHCQCCPSQYTACCQARHFGRDGPVCVCRDAAYADCRRCPTRMCLCAC